jgi:hypothetical protein
MPAYIATFRKRVLSDSGRESWAVQQKLDIRADDRSQATKLAQKQFCEIERIQTWKDRADDLVLEEADFPS